MKLNDKISEYDVKDLSKIRDTVKTINKSIDYLDRITTNLLHNAQVTENNFNSANMDRAKNILNEYKKNFKNANEEMTELLKSVEEFTNKLQHAWREW